MLDFLVQFLSRLAVMLPVILLLVAVVWLIFSRRRFSAGTPSFNPSNLRTWSIRFALVDGAVFAIVFALVSASMADSQLSAGLAGGLAALVAIGVMPRLAVRYPQLSGQ